jgi:hypothetical protein
VSGRVLSCRSCSAPIFFAHTVDGKRMPIDATAAVGGNVRLDERGVAHVVGATIDLFDPTDDGERWMPHFATYPYAGEWT